MNTPAPHDANVIIYGGPKSDRIQFTIDGKPMMELSPEGFYVRGELVPQGDGEAAQVYQTFMGWFRRIPK